MSSITEGIAALSAASHAFDITPHDTNELAHNTRGIWIGGAGNLSLILEHDTEAVTLVGIPAGTLLPLQAKIVKSTGTTVTSIIGLW